MARAATASASGDSSQLGRRPAEHLWVWRLTTVIAFVAVWALAVEVGWVSSRLFVGPVEVLAWLWGWITSGDALGHVWATLSAALLGYLVGFVVGALIASLFVALPTLADVFDPYMAILNGIPKIVIAPLTVLVFGLGVGSKVALAALLVFFVTFFNIYNGLRSVDKALIANLRVLGAGRLRMALDLYLPAILTWAFSAMRLSVGFALVGVIVGEFVGAREGVGWTIKIAAEQNVPERLLGGLVVLGIIAAVVDNGLSRAERRTSAWRVF